MHMKRTRQLHRIMNLPQAKRFGLMAVGLQLLIDPVETLDVKISPAMLAMVITPVSPHRSNSPG
jgi:hypothetical protein